MPNTAILFGRLLVVLGIIGYGYGIYAMPDKASWTALIPSFFGAVLLVMGHLSNAYENLRKHLMHVAVLVGLIGFIVPLTRIKFADFQLTFAASMLILMSLLSLIFVILCVKSFIDARRSGAV